MRWLVVVLAGLLASPAVLAQGDKGPYIGLGYGVFEFEDDGGETGINFSDTAASYRLFGGYNVHESLAIEIGIGKSAGFNEQLVGIDPVFGPVELDLGADYDLTTVRVLFMAPFNGVDMFGGIGFYDGDIKFTQHFRAQFAEALQTVETSIGGATVIGGVQFHLDRLIIRGEYEWFDDDKGITTQALNLAVIFPFGRR